MMDNTMLRAIPALRFMSLQAMSISLAGRISKMLSLSRSRKDLSRLDSRLLADVAIGEEEARAEAARRAWDAPPHWFDNRSRWS